MDYGQLLQKAAQITWRYKFLWLFGFIMALCGQGGRIDLQSNYSTSSSESGGGGGFPDTPSDFSDLPSFLPEPFGETSILTYILFFAIIALIFWVFWLIAGAIGRGGIIKTVDRAEQGETVTFGQSWADGMKHLFSLASLQGLLYIPLYLLWGIGLVSAATQLWPLFVEFVENPVAFEHQFDTDPISILGRFLGFFVLICAVICFSWLIELLASFFVTFGSRAIVLEGNDMISALGRSASLFRQNMGPTIIITLMIMVIRTILGVVLLIPAAVIMAPVMLLILPGLMNDGLTGGIFLFLGFIMFMAHIFFSLLMGILQVFIEAMWTLAYREFGEEVSPLEDGISL